MLRPENVVETVMPSIAGTSSRPDAVGQAQRKPDEGERADRQVDVEDPAPARVLYEQPAEQRTDDCGQGEGGRDVALVAATLTRRHEIAHRGHRQGHQPTRSYPLDRA